jgi:hypothetical protein
MFRRFCLKKTDITRIAADSLTAKRTERTERTKVTIAKLTLWFIIAAHVNAAII